MSPSRLPWRAHGLPKTSGRVRWAPAGLASGWVQSGGWPSRVLMCFETGDRHSIKALRVQNQPFDCAIFCANTFIFPLRPPDQGYLNGYSKGSSTPFSSYPLTSAIFTGPPQYSLCHVQCLHGGCGARTKKPCLRLVVVRLVHGNCSAAVLHVKPRRPRVRGRAARGSGPGSPGPGSIGFVWLQSPAGCASGESARFRPRCGKAGYLHLSLPCAGPVPARVRTPGLWPFHLVHIHLSDCRQRRKGLVQARCPW